MNTNSTGATLSVNFVKPSLNAGSSAKRPMVARTRRIAVLISSGSSSVPEMKSSNFLAVGVVRVGKHAQQHINIASSWKWRPRLIFSLILLLSPVSPSMMLESRSWIQSAHGDEIAWSFSVCTVENAVEDYACTRTCWCQRHSHLNALKDVVFGLNRKRLVLDYRK